MNTSIRLITLRAFSLTAACSRRILLTLCFLSGLLCAPVAAADEPEPAAVQELHASAVEGEFAPILLIDHGDPSRPLVNEFVRDLQRLSGRAGQRRNVVVESIRQQGTQTIHRLDQSVYRECSIVLLHGRPAYEYAEACFERQLFLPGTQFLLLQRYGQEPVLKNQEFFDGVRAIDTGDLYPQETLQAGLEAFPDRRSLIFVGSFDGAYAERTAALARAAKQFSNLQNLEFISVSPEQLQRIAAAGNQQVNSLRLNDILQLPLQKPIVFYWAVTLYGESTCDPAEFVSYLGKVCNTGNSDDCIPILALSSTLIAPGTACLGVCADTELLAERVLRAIDGQDTPSSQGMALICDPNYLFELGGLVPEQQPAPESSGVSTEIPVKYLSNPQLKEYSDRADQLEAEAVIRSNYLSNAIIAIGCLVAVFIALIYQIIRRRRLETQLTQSQYAIEQASTMTTLGTFCAALTHELSQPLAAIMNNADAALRMSKQSADSDITGILKDILDDNQRARRILERIADFIRRGSLETCRVNLSAISSDVQAMLENRCGAAGVSLQKRLARGCPDANADPVAIQIILLNLVDNAIRAIISRRQMPTATKVAGSADCIRLSFSESATEPSFVAIRVSDTGIGLQDGTPEQLLQPFFTTHETGLGMGLAIVQLLVEQQGGKIRITANKGAGLTVTVYLPACRVVEAGKEEVVVNREFEIST